MRGGGTLPARNHTTMAIKYKSTRTVEHSEIRQWIEERAGRPALVILSENGTTSVLRIDFGEPDEALLMLSWDEFFRIFEENNLSFMYLQEGENGERSYSYAFVSRLEPDDVPESSDEEEEEIKKGPEEDDV